MKKNLLILSSVFILAIIAWLIYNKYRVVIPPVDTTKSEVGWSAKSVSDTHYGKVQLSKATLEFKDSKLVGGAFEIDMNTITVEDITDAKHNSDFIRHITTGDFFQTDQFPSASFTISDVEPISESEFIVSGDITIKAITKQIQFKTTITKVNDIRTARATIVLDKNQFGIDYGGKDKPGSQKDWFIYDDFTLNVNIVCK